MIAFLFDNDGVLVDSTEYHWAAWDALMQEFPELAMSKKDFSACFGKRNDLILQEVAPYLDKKVRTMLALRKEEIFREIAANRVKLIPGIEPFLIELQKEGVARIIASSAPLKNLEMFVTVTPLHRYFDQYLSAEEMKHGKPAPDIFLAAAKALRYRPKHCIVIEDAPAGIVAGKRAGCFVIALGTTHKKEELVDANLYYSTASELDLTTVTKAFERWQKRSLMDRIHDSDIFKSLTTSRWRYVVGGFLVALGSILFFLPIGPGLFFIFLGLYIINREWTNRNLAAFKKWYKKWKKKK